MWPCRQKSPMGSLLSVRATSPKAQFCRFRCVCGAMNRLPRGKPLAIVRLSETILKRSNSKKPVKAFSQRSVIAMLLCDDPAWQTRKNSNALGIPSYTLLPYHNPRKSQQHVWDRGNTLENQNHHVLSQIWRTGGKLLFCGLGFSKVGHIYTWSEPYFLGIIWHYNCCYHERTCKYLQYKKPSAPFAQQLCTGPCTSSVGRSPAHSMESQLCGAPSPETNTIRST